MLEPILAEESTITKLVTSLEGIIQDLNENSTHHDYLVALLIVLLEEAGFHMSTNDKSVSRSHNLKSLRIPKDWKLESKVYDISFRLHAVPDVKCKLVAVPSGDTLIINFYPVIEDRRTYSISVRTLKYVNPFSSYLSGRYRNLKEISHRFKDSIATPVRLDVSMNAGIICPGLQGLPLELKFKILRLLPLRDLRRLAQCSSEFYQLCSDPELKEHIE